LGDFENYNVVFNKVLEEIPMSSSLGEDLMKLLPLFDQEKNR